jgi:hypothetical protein
MSWKRCIVARPLLAACLLLAAGPMVSPALGSLVVQDVAPYPNSVGAVWVPRIEADFNLPIDPQSVNLLTYNTRGQRTGPVGGEFSFLSGQRTVRFDPFESPYGRFDAGELVEVTLGQSLRSVSGEPMLMPVTWEFRTLAQTGSGQFNVSQDQNTGYGTVAVEAGYLDSDDRIDLVVVTLRGDIRVLKNTTPPGERVQTYESHSFPIGENFSSVLLRDLSGDGLLDIAASDQQADLIRVGHNLGDGTQYEWSTWPTCSHPQRLAAGDLNGDGFEDLVFPCQYAAQVSVMLGVGDCLFEPPVTYPVGEWPIDVVVRDLDLDGDLDMVVSNELSQQITILRNLDPTAPPEEMFEVLPSLSLTAPVGIVVDDLNGDHLPDIAVATVDSARVGFLQMLPDCQLAPVRLYPTGGGPTEKLRGLATLDYDGDGDLDLGVTNSDANVWVLMENDGTGALAPSTQRPTADRPIQPMAADLDRDGCVDFVVPTRQVGKVRLYYNLPVPAATGEPLPQSGATPAPVLLAAYPNPFRDNVRLTMNGAPAGRLEIVDASGRLVRAFDAARQGAGGASFEWDGRDNVGRPVPPGAYFARTGTPLQGRAILIRLR